MRRFKGQEKEAGINDQWIALIVDESKWLAMSMSAAMICVALHQLRLRRSDLPGPRRVLAAMNLFFAVTIGVMAFGHLLAVTTKYLVGTLEGAASVFYLIGMALAGPSWWLIYHSLRSSVSGDGPGHKTLFLNAWLAITLLALGLHNLPLAAPGFLNIGYQVNSHRVVGWCILVLAVLVNLGLFVGSWIFLASGQSFEQFRGG